MVFLRSVTPAEIGPVVQGDGVMLRVPQMSDFEEWAALRAASRAFLIPWEPTWPADDLTRSAFRRRIRRYWRDVREDVSYPFFVFRAHDDALLGGLTLSNVRRGVAQTAALGYWLGQPFSRRGYMTAAVDAVLPFAFNTLGLHRVEAACLPTNGPSIRLLRRCGFAEEGYARHYLKINGEWRDHLLFAILADDR